MADASMLGNSGYDRVENDFYATPTICTVAAANWLTLHGLISTSSVILEPACGSGEMSTVLASYVKRVISSDISPKMPGASKADFLKMKIPDVDGIITNPPYGELLDDFMGHGVAWVKEGGSKSRFMALLMRNEVDNAVTRQWAFKTCPVFMAKLPLLWRPRWIVGSTGSPRHNYSWYVWSTKRAGGPAQIDWLSRPE